ncbi:MAG: hypothetical protein JSS13_03190, partial [Proteobacteria bacterium]|nr:hypothetical protein [Pseudomonadota bacterium]
AALLLLLSIVWRDSSLDPVAKSAATFCLAFGLFWLGNMHALTLPGDGVHVYLVLVCVALALRLVVAPDAKPAQGRFALAAMLCCVASFTFGSGMASFIALATLLWPQHGGTRRLIQLGLVAMAALSLYLLLPGARHMPQSGVLHPLQSAQYSLQILGIPFVYLFWPLLDPAAAAAVPGPLHGIALTTADFWTANYGSIRTSIFPQALIGTGVLCATVAATWRLRESGNAARVGITLAWFGIACAGLIALARGSYFDAHPEQVYALRYLPWIGIAWCGLLLAGIARTTCAQPVYALVLCLPLLALPSELGLLKLAQHVQSVAEDSALGAAVGVLPADLPLGETRLEDVRAALPALRAANTAMFAWPASAALRHSLPANAHRLVAASVDVDTVTNVLGANAIRLRAEFSTPACAQHVLAAVDGVFVGLLRRADWEEWRGFVAADATTGFDFYALCN